MTITNVYKELISQFVMKNKFNNEKTLLFFQGFPGIFYETLNDMRYKRLSSYDLNNNHYYCDCLKMNNRLELNALLNSDGLRWAYYEELISLTGILNDFNVYTGRIIVVKNNLYNGYFPIDINADEKNIMEIFDDDSNKEDVITKFYSDAKVYNSKIFFSYINKHYDVDLNKKIEEINFFEGNQKVYRENILDGNVVNLNDLEYEKYKLLNGLIHDAKYVIKMPESKEINNMLLCLNSFGEHFNVSFIIDKSKRTLEYEFENKYLKLFKTYWGQGACFRDITIYEDPATSTKTVNLSQGILISKVIEQSINAKDEKTYSDMVITAPTGTGKSIFFQVPSIYLHKEYGLLTIVISPLIALMNDQVNEIEGRNIDFATYINSEITFEERQDRIIGIKNGKYSIVYLSPELLLANDIRNIIGDRKIGLFVIDEAHLVTSWGRDFRVDYWFLGEYIEKLRVGSKYNDPMKFPVLCLTATAVFGGRDDVVGDLLKSMSLVCSQDNIYFGSVRRDNGTHSIEFNINVAGEKKSNTKKEDKIDLTCKKMIELIESNKKSIVYFPYVSQIEDVFKKIIEMKPSYKRYIEKYSGSGMDKYEKNESYNRFKNSSLSIMLATKAFGMGINIPDVEVVYHYAPTGTLADYVQEIGRAARKIERGYAMIDYLKNDMNYASVLWGLSGLRHYQIKAIMKKLYNLYVQKNNRNLLISPEIFGYIFDSKSIDNKVKSGLMLLSSDLLEKYHFRVINVRAKNIFSIHYICIPSDTEDNFLKEYGSYCEVMMDDKPRITAGFGKSSEVHTYNIGKIYEIDLSKVWEKKFDDITFANFKYKFFMGELFSSADVKIAPRIRLEIHYNENYDIAKNKLSKIASSLQAAFNTIKRKYGGREFSFDDFSINLQNYYKEKIKREYLILLLDLFCYEGVGYDEIPTEQWKFIEKRRKSNETHIENSYCFRTNKYGFVEQSIKRYLKNSEPNSDDRKSFIAYLPIPKNGQHYSEFQLVASMLEMFGLATYELSGGRNSQIFVRINDPLKLKRLSESEKYKNILLTEIEERHKRAAKIVNNFMLLDKTNNERWDLIEHYFLGYDELINYELELDESEAAHAES
ncbi:DEAD/DEAH box helicase [Sedimentibacter sp.]|uniref:DEAD/DEAH box helicase n=3 Tax=Sedimentibacter sp. TaxID=1960295 RepID=UPI0028A9A37D|nr:DEAD/DEAH box helicase [Sedimentibacter sp.]